MKKAIILAAGHGKRLNHLTQEKPKPLLQVGDKPIIEHIIKQLNDSEIYHIGINTHYLSSQIKEYLQKRPKDKNKFTIIKEEELSGTAGAVRIFKSFMEDVEDFIVIAGDIVSEANLQELLSFHQERSALASFYYHERKQSNSIVNLNEESGMVTSFHERPPSSLFVEGERYKVNSSIYAFNKEIFNYLSDPTLFDIPKDLFPKIISKQKLYARKLKGYRFAIDNEQRLEQANQYFNEELQ
ncbi:MAG: nucleotidyltransferase family protein [Bdellovibrionota bacterium]|nr:nucleotidyltransferase family protein [Bdellovibrionota bacterium]